MYYDLIGKNSLKYGYLQNSSFKKIITAERICNLITFSLHIAFCKENRRVVCDRQWIMFCSVL